MSVIVKVVKGPIEILNIRRKRVKAKTGAVVTMVSQKEFQKYLTSGAIKRINPSAYDIGVLKRAGAIKSLKPADADDKNKAPDKNKKSEAPKDEDKAKPDETKDADGQDNPPELPEGDDGDEELVNISDLKIGDCIDVVVNGVTLKNGEIIQTCADGTYHADFDEGEDKNYRVIKPEQITEVLQINDEDTEDGAE